MSSRRWLLAPVVAVACAACGEKVQTIPIGAAKVADAPPWQNKDSRFLAPGWTPGNETSWNDQITVRAQGQNDYAPRK